MKSFVICTSNAIMEQWYKDTDWIHLAQDRNQWSTGISRAADHLLPVQQGLCYTGFVILNFIITVNKITLFSDKCMFLSSTGFVILNFIITVNKTTCFIDEYMFLSDYNV
jgi:hypothetical protein